MSLKNKLTIAVLALTLVTGAHLASAEKPVDAGKADKVATEEKGNKKMGEERMPRMLEEQDKDGDGKISLEEFKAHSEVLFAKKDKNSDGYITKDEMRHPKKFKGKRDGKGPEGLSSEGDAPEAAK